MSTPNTNSPNNASEQLQNNKIEPKKIAIIMAGGKGQTLWPLSTEDRPKQFVHFWGDGTLIQNSYQRCLQFFEKEDVYIVTSFSSKNLLLEQIPELDQTNLILEPFPRHTLPCLATSYYTLSQKYHKDDIFFAFSADHVIANEGEFFASLETAYQTAIVSNGIVTIGIKPTRITADFGYLQFDDQLEGLENLWEKGVRKVITFAEKPDINTARRFVESGEFLWNAGIFAMSFDKFQSSFVKYQAVLFTLFDELNNVNQENFYSKLEFIYKQIKSISIDYGIMEYSKDIYVVKSTFKWSDLGSWDEVYRLSLKDGKDNVLHGDVIAINSNNCMVHSSDKQISIVDVDNIIIIESKDSILLTKRKNSESVKEITDFIKLNRKRRLL